MKIFQYDTIDSTNNEAKRLIQQGETPLFAVYARQQTAGRGRLGRPWETPTGNVAVTMTVKPPKDLSTQSTIAPMTALAIYDVLKPLMRAEDRLAIKWPNDILINEAKVSGTLIEADRSAIYIGVGINVETKPEHVPYKTICLSELAEVKAEKLVTELTAAFEKYYTRWQHEGFGTLTSLYNKRLFRLNQPLRISLDREKQTWQEGICCGVNQDGHLQLKDDQGHMKAHSAGDIDAPR
ncbi:biotin--[acetyl-CoA-carboxylase] ligase [Bacillus xiamenensis]|uniref:Biotin--[acetyl-CoA-carboxylase] ligase n=1 Tax=Bacillus xiamenensis TaxID=1178537 RepID=A0AAC9NCK6_9BACI|nr:MULTISPECIES: biotin--[acetyl-CoA-carboxylase] ligase [Bacillus]AOZ90711.1 biotin--[acetyl-CoA-carboxylase] ligase [Bacillus xiamenensis]MBG9911169.1 biotin--acetyl-CoA-carboxylase ligase [Bacillus xiamenensis]MCW1835919.1 biotin--[acetyl-CoA-carboxylase] ligase [Bacillus xiamenensis]MCY9575646.1 biotin--[acetyl-CoA-carboxylase] ligase [Bacillus xiamenensis]QGX65202.1 biotin--[acetyl-CoA-carboxylase] ligase [Bacillus sp. ms-22]